MVWPVLLMSCGVEAASLCTVVDMADNDCNAVLAALMLVLTLVIVVVNAEMLDNCCRAAIAKPSPEPMPE